MAPKRILILLRPLKATLCMKHNEFARYFLYGGLKLTRILFYQLILSKCALCRRFTG